MGCWASVQESTVGVVETCGKYDRLSNSGCVCLNPLKCERVAGRVTLRIQQLDVIVETKSKDNVFVHIVVSVQYCVIHDAIYDAYYKLTNPREQITAFVFDVVRAEVPKIDLDDVFITKDEIAKAIKDELTKMMGDFGFEILKTLITDIRPDEKVKSAMNDINASERLKMAALETGEARKIGMIKQAEAEAESKYLGGVGIARQRTAIVDGLRDSVINFARGVDGSTSKDVMDLVLITQYFDTMKEIGSKGSGSSLFIPHSPAAVATIAAQIRSGFFSMAGGDTSTTISGMTKAEQAQSEKESDPKEEKKPKKGKEKVG